MKPTDNFNSDLRDTGIQPIDISHEVRNSFLDYAMSVIVSRALPDVRDGLKPVHRRIVYAMNSLGMTSAQPHKKSARIVGDVIAKYHPHGDSAVYETMVRLAQEFASRYPLVDGHGNFGSIDGDSAAAMRYTEARMSKIAGEMVRDINKDTVDFIPNYDGEETEPVVLPARFPNLLANGSSGIAVGMATNIPPHNLGELIDTVLALAKNPDLSVVDIMTQYLPGPDFPTGGAILGKSGIKKAYETGNGSIVIRSKCDIEDMDHGKKRIVVTEIPYQVNKATMIEKIADLVKNKVVEGITDLRDESNREGIRVIIELRKDVIPEVILNQLFKYSPLQVSFGINLLALVNGEPKVLSVKEILLHYLNHQLDITRRKVRYELDKAIEREHLLRGLSVAIFHIDEVIDIIKTSANGDEADQRLQALLQLSERQSKAVLDMKLQRLTGMEQEKIELEITELQKNIEEMRATLEDPDKLLGVIERDLLDVKNRFGDARRTEFSNDSSMIEDEELIPEEQVIVTLTTNGYIKRVNCDTYRAQNRGGKGIKGITTNDNDAVEKLLITSTHTDLLFFTNLGKVYRIRGHQVPEYSRQGKGLPVVNLLSMEDGETVQAIISVDAYDEDHQLMFVTTGGVVKRVSMSQFENIRQNGKIAVTLREGDRLLNVKKTTGEEEILIASTLGKVVRFASTDVRVMGRTATGVTGIDLGDATAVGVSTSVEGEYILAITAKGYGKMSPREDYRFTKRGGKGVITVNATEKTGPLVAMRAVNGDEDLLVTTSKGTLIRISLNQVKVAGRNTQGVRIIRMDDDQEVASIAVTEPEPEETVDIVEETDDTIHNEFKQE